MDVREGCCTWNLNLGWGAKWKVFALAFFELARCI
jgi:hypothetical protein